MNGADVWLDRLDAALAEERRALIEHDVEALVRSTRDKLESLRQLEAEPPAPASAQRLRLLAEANRANTNRCAPWSTFTIREGVIGPTFAHSAWYCASSSR